MAASFFCQVATSRIEIIIYFLFKFGFISSIFFGDSSILQLFSVFFFYFFKRLKLFLYIS